MAAGSAAHTQQRPAQHRPAAVALVDAPMAHAWPARHSWSDAVEAEYGAFVATIGHAIAAGRCHTLSGCLNDAAINPLHEAGSLPLRFYTDCADTPYTLRAYFAYRSDLPFAYSRRMTGQGHDPRYLRGARPAGTRLWTDFSTPRQLLESIGSDVHSGYFRTAPDVQDADSYQTAVDRLSIRPGTMYYNPNGHVLVVYEVTAAGDILLFDGHPGNTLTHPRFTERFPLGSAPFGGGFRNFRPIAYEAGHVVRAPNLRIPEYGGIAQFNRAAYAVDGHAATFHAWVRARMATAFAAAATSVPWREPAVSVFTERVMNTHAARVARATARATARALRARIAEAGRVVTASIAVEMPHVH